MTNKKYNTAMQLSVYVSLKLVSQGSLSHDPFVASRYVSLSYTVLFKEGVSSVRYLGCALLCCVTDHIVPVYHGIVQG